MKTTQLQNIMKKLKLNDYTYNDQSVSETAFQLTAYERYGCIDFEDYLKDKLSAEIDITYLADYIDYCYHVNAYDDVIYSINEFDEVFRSEKPYNIARMVYHGTFTTAKKYFTYNGDGNIKSLEEYEVTKEMRENTEFLEWYIENNIENDNYYEGFKEDCLKVAYELLKLGY